MKRRKIMARICAFTLVASLIAVDALPTFASAASEEPAVDRMQVKEEFVDEIIVSTGDTEAENIAGRETVRETESESETEMSDGTETRLEMLDGAETESGIISFSAAGEAQETASENNDGLIYLDGALCNGYYMDSAGILYIVSNGVAELKTGIVSEGTKYYSQDAGRMTLSNATVYVAGKVYTGYYVSRGNKMYSVKKGTPTLKSGVVKAGAKYYSYNSGKKLKLSKETVYVKGKVYTGYYMSRGNKMYSVKKGTRTLKSGAVKAGAKYYSYNSGKKLKLSKETVYVKGKVYTGYYMSRGNKMYSVKKGTRTLKSGTVKAGAKYYSYNTGKKQTLSNETVYVAGKAYTGYYMDSGNKMYSVEKGTRVLVNTTLNAGTEYYSYNAGKTLTLSEQTVYVNGKAMEGMSAESLATLQRAQAVVNSITNDSMAKEEKLRVCFDFVKTYEESKPRVPHYTGMDWPVVYANDMFVNGTGNCCSYAAAFAYMAKAIGYEEVYCCNSGGHGWAEIDGLIYDPEWSKWHHVYNYYALSYDTPTDQNYKGAIGAGKPWMHIKI